MHWEKRYWANYLTAFRLVFLPLFFVAVAYDQAAVFAGLFVLHTALDGLDGLVARGLHIQSDFGRRLDTLVDALVWLPGLAIFLWFMRGDLNAIFSAYPHLFIVPVITALAMNLTAYHYLGSFAAIHLYTAKLTAGMILLLLVVVLLDQFYPLLGYLTALTGVIYHLEAIVIYVQRKDQTDENVTSLWQVIQQKDTPKWKNAD